MSAGVTRANTSPPATSHQRVVVERRELGPVSGSPPARSSARAIAAAVTGWSPVSIATSMPASRRRAATAAAVGRSGIAERDETDQLDPVVELPPPERRRREVSLGDGEHPEPALAPTMRAGVLQPGRLAAADVAALEQQSRGRP